MALDFIDRHPMNDRPIFQVGEQRLIFEATRAAFYVEHVSIAAVIFGKDYEGNIHLLDEWEDSLTQMKVSVADKVSEWRKDYGLGQVALGRIPDMPESSAWASHPLAKEIKKVEHVDCYVARSFSIQKGILTHLNLIEEGKLKTEHFSSYNRIVEKIKRIEPNQPTNDPLIMAFLLALSERNGTVHFSTAPAIWW